MQSENKPLAHAGMQYSGTEHFKNGDLTKHDRQRAEELVRAIEHFVHRCDQIERNLHQAMNPVIRAFAPGQEIIVIDSAEKRRRITEILIDQLDDLGFETRPPSASDDIALDDLGCKRLEEAFENCRFLLYRYAKSPSSALPVNAVDGTIFRVLKSAREIASDFLDIQSTRYWDSDCLAEPAYTKVLACLPERRLHRLAAAAEVHAAIDNLFINTLLLETQSSDTAKETRLSTDSDDAPEDISKSVPSEETTKLPANYILCTTIAGIVRKRSDAIARTLKNAHYPVIKVNNKNYCNPDQAAAIFPKWKKYLKNKLEK